MKEKIKKEVKEVWDAMSGAFMIGLAVAFALVGMLELHGALVCVACIFLTIEGLERM